MDDIDRLDKGEIQTVFKLIKVSADFPYTTYLLFFDDAIVSTALEERYASKSSEPGRGFLEKIIQVPLPLPKIDRQSLQKFCFEGLKQALKDVGVAVTDEQWHEFTYHFIGALDSRLETPRMCKRYANAVLFSMGLLKGEVNPVDLLLIEGVRVLFPAVYNLIRGNRTAIRRLIRALKEKEDVADLRGYEKEGFLTLMGYLFAWTEAYYDGSNHPDRDDPEDTNYPTSIIAQRVSSRFYFDRYFSYAILPVRSLTSACARFSRASR